LFPCRPGPTGKILLMPEDPNAVLICVATGTGIAPFRSFWRRCFYENVPNYKFSGLFWVFMGVANSDSKLYDDEMQVGVGVQEGVGVTGVTGVSGWWLHCYRKASCCVSGLLNNYDVRPLVYLAEYWDWTEW
jgi:hypothetical protein